MLREVFFFFFFVKNFNVHHNYTNVVLVVWILWNGTLVVWILWKGTLAACFFFVLVTFVRGI